MVSRHLRSSSRRDAMPRAGPLVPERQETVFVPEQPPLPLALYTQLEARHLLASPDGTAVAATKRGPGNTVVVVHSDPEVRLPPIPFDRAMIVQTFPRRGARVWGERAGTAGVWMLSPEGVRFLAPMSDVRHIARTASGNAVVGTAGPGTLAYVVRESSVVVPAEADVAFGASEHPETLLPMSNGMRGLWLHPPSAFADLPVEAAAPVLWPLPFLADRARLFSQQGQSIYLLSTGGVDTFAVPYEDLESPRANATRMEYTRITPEGTRNGVEWVWPAPPNARHGVAVLMRLVGADGQVRRRLLVDGTAVFQGSFFMDRNRFRWSSGGDHWVAHLTRVDDSGQQLEEVLVTSSGQPVVHARPEMVHEPRIDDDGRLAYVLAVSNRASPAVRHVVLGGQRSPAYEYAWNLFGTGGAVSANVLDRGRILRVQFFHGR